MVAMLNPRIHFAHLIILAHSYGCCQKEKTVQPLKRGSQAGEHRTRQDKAAFGLHITHVALHAWVYSSMYIPVAGSMLLDQAQGSGRGD